MAAVSNFFKPPQARSNGSLTNEDSTLNTLFRQAADSLDKQPVPSDSFPKLAWRDFNKGGFGKAYAADKKKDSIAAHVGLKK